MLNKKKDIITPLLDQVRGTSLTDEQLAEKAIELARVILISSSKQMKLSERYQAWKMNRMMDDPLGKALTLAMADQVFRPTTHVRSADQFRYLVDEYGVPDYLPLHEKIAMRVGASASAVAPEIVMPAVTAKMRSESDNVILPSEDELLKPHLLKRRKSETRMNINQLGEAILGEEEATHRLQQVIDRLESPECEYISVKISAIFSQINLVAYQQTLEEIKERLRLLYRTSMKHQFIQQDGTKTAKFVNLDMEEYRDLHLTCDAFKQVLMEREFVKMRAGIVLQAYLPDSFEVQKDLTVWARSRVSSGGAGIKIRIVKGANLAMESVEASIHDWAQAPYTNKLDVDANYKRMVEYGSQPDHAEVVNLGVASHNLFEISYALLLRAMHGVDEYVEFEMLEGMANHQARAVQKSANGMLLYAPVVKKEDFHSAISYLVRRLDENTAEQNFLHDLFGMRPGCPLWDKQKAMFLAACKKKDRVQSEPNRNQNRETESHVVDYSERFENAADTDWSLRHNQNWALKSVRDFDGVEISTVPIVINGETLITSDLGTGRDPSRNVDTYQFSFASQDQVMMALDVAEKCQPAWEGLGIEARGKILKDVAIELANCRAEAISVMVMDAGKAIPEGDAELSEAIDFANYYAESLGWDGMFDGSEMKALGVVVITPPWNFPFAIPCGGILAALMAGNSVIMKPPVETVLTAWVMVNMLWDAGVPRDVLQFVTCPNNEIGRSLVTDPRVGSVVLTGAFETGRMFQDWNPNMRLIAETSGKNSLIITNAADPDQAVKDLVKGSFGHAGQKCSASSLAIIEADLYDNPAFIRQLRDAAASLTVGSSWDPASIVTPVVRPPGRELHRALTRLEEGEEWLLEPKMIDENPCLWSPGIKLGTRPGSWYCKTECFGPVLGLVRARDLQHAMEIQNDSDFGLTGGIHTLDTREIELWRDQVEVGNAYINRSITGAIVRRQPFGGWKNSCFGPGAKAGGPNYVALFGDWSQVSDPKLVAQVNDEISDYATGLSQDLNLDQDALMAAAGSYIYWWEREFSIEHDPTQLLGEDNHFRYRRLRRILVRGDSMSDLELALVLLAGKVLDVAVDISLGVEREGIDAVIESEAVLCERLESVNKFYNSLRAPNASDDLRRAANDARIQVIGWEAISNGRIELLHYLREQSVSETTHRYGNIIPKPEDCM
ncbi:MAG: proline dehydrogenase family protein [Akkermansiaceae bacterium]